MSLSLYYSHMFTAELMTNDCCCVLIRQIPEHLEPTISIWSQDKLRKKKECLFYMQTHAYFRDLYSYKLSNQNLLAAETTNESDTDLL